MSCVLDASIGAKWLIEEPDSHLAEQILTLGETFLAPDLFAIEVAASLTKRHRGRQITGEQLDLSLSRLERIVAQDLVVESTSHLVSRSAHMSRVLHHSLYDCVYLALAEHLNAPLMTADLVFVRKVTGSEWLGLAMSLDEVNRIFS